jgi:SAM-dependent methyltransferase
MAEINLLDRYPKSKRPIEQRGRRKLSGSGYLKRNAGPCDNQEILFQHKLLDVARGFGYEYFDADRLYGYGGYYYHPRFWTGTVERLREYYHLAEDASILDVGCAKGFLLYDFLRWSPKLNLKGLDISSYARDHAPDEVRPLITVGNAKALPFDDRSFDLVISINTVDHLPLEECKTAIREIQRVTRKNAFISVNAWRTDEDHARLMKWNITAVTVLHVDGWKKLFAEVGYTGDYWWFIP